MFVRHIKNGVNLWKKTTNKSFIHYKHQNKGNFYKLFKFNRAFVNSSILRCSKEIKDPYENINVEKIEEEIVDSESYNKALDYLRIAEESFNNMTNATSTQDVNIHSNKAIQYFKKSLELGKSKVKSSDIMFKIGVCYYTRKELENAITYFNYVEENEPSFIPVYKYIGDCYHYDGIYPLAISYYDKYFKDFYNYYDRVIAEAVATQGEQMKDILNKEVETALAEILLKRGVSYYHMNSIGGYAIEDFKAILELETPYKAYALYWIGKVKERKSEYWEAIDYFEKSLKENPNLWESYDGIADAYEALGKDEMAEDFRLRASHLKRKMIWESKINQANSIEQPEFSFEDYITINKRGID